MSISTIIQATEENKAKRDRICKLLISNRQFLSRILKEFVPEYRDCELEKIQNYYIEPDSVRVSDVAVEKNLSNIKGRNTEDASVNEATVYYDILFDAAYPNGEKDIGIIINLEIQNDVHPGYPLEARGVYYASRVLSSQLQTINRETNYGKLEKVYSLWLLIGDNQSEEAANTAVMYHITETSLVGKVQARKGAYDLISVIMVRISENKETDNETIRLLAKLFSNSLSKDDKLEYLENAGIVTSGEIGKGVTDMCNLSEAIYQDGIAQGTAQGIAQGTANTEALWNERLSKLIGDGLLTAENVSKSLGLKLEDVKAMISSGKVQQD